MANCLIYLVFKLKSFLSCLQSLLICNYIFLHGQADHHAPKKEGKDNGWMVQAGTPIGMLFSAPLRLRHKLYSQRALTARTQYFKTFLSRLQVSIQGIQVSKYLFPCNSISIAKSSAGFIGHHASVESVMSCR